MLARFDSMPRGLEQEWFEDCLLFAGSCSLVLRIYLRIDRFFSSHFRSSLVQALRALLQQTTQDDVL